MMHRTMTHGTTPMISENTVLNSVRTLFYTVLNSVFGVSYEIVFMSTLLSCVDEIHQVVVFYFF